MQNSKIEWTDHTFNPWHGCQRVSPGCERCYAETLNHRYGFDNWGPAKTTERRGMSENYWRQPLRWNAAARKAGQRARVFCASMADVFEDHPQVTDWRMRLFNLIDMTPSLDWLLLTKRPENVNAMMADWLEGTDFPSNIWLGTSVEDQRRADERIPHLLRVPARVRFLSCEPLLGPLDLSRWIFDRRKALNKMIYGPAALNEEQADSYVADMGIHWLIVGGESGPGARPMHPDWPRALRDQCQAAGVAFFFKQWGEWLPSDVRCSVQYPATMSVAAKIVLDENKFCRVGKKAAGRLLDGAEWNQFPNEVLA